MVYRTGVSPGRCWGAAEALPGSCPGVEGCFCNLIVEQSLGLGAVKTSHGDYARADYGPTQPDPKSAQTGPKSAPNRFQINLKFINFESQMPPNGTQEPTGTVRNPQEPPSAGVLLGRCWGAAEALPGSCPGVAEEHPFYTTCRPFDPQTPNPSRRWTRF